MQIKPELSMVQFLLSETTLKLLTRFQSNLFDLYLKLESHSLVDF